jgi:3-hydroxybutyrate dehydrogenase
MKMKDKVCIVTGAARGIGEGIAKRYVEEGAKVAIADLNFYAAEETAEKLTGAGPGEAMGVAMNVQIVHKLESFPFDDWKQLLSIHLDGAFLTSRACLPHMYEKGSGAIIFMGSVHSKEASPLKSAYVTAKHGLLGLARVISKEGADHGVRANVICPGFVKTPLVEKQIPEQAKELGISEEEVVNKIMLGETVDKEFTTIEDVAEVALLFASFPTNALTGQSLVVSHGWFMD